MAPRVTETENNEPYNRFCVSCRRGCKQPEFAVISSCPRYYPLRKKQVIARQWKQAELFTDV